MLAALAALALPASASASGPASASASAAAAAAADFSVRVHIANHTPVVGRRWPIELTVTHAKQKLKGSVRYQFLFDKTVVSTEPKHGAYDFTHGVYRDDLVFPTQAAGERLTLRFVVHTKYGTRRVDWAIRARKSA